VSANSIIFLLILINQSAKEKVPGGALYFGLAWALGLGFRYGPATGPVILDSPDDTLNKRIVCLILFSSFLFLFLFSYSVTQLSFLRWGAL
jgi:hypothetical protein